MATIMSEACPLMVVSFSGLSIRYIDIFGHGGINKFLTMKRIRENGYAVSDAEVNAGAKAVSAPIFDHKGKLLAGLTIAGPSERINNDLLSDFILMVKEKAEEISRDFSYTNE